MSCYRFLKVTDHDSDDILFELLDATYIIHLFNNGRYPSIMTQLTLYKPSKNTFIVVNKGYKKCTKDLQKLKINLIILINLIDLIKCKCLMPKCSKIV